jgi:hypothetical protein
MTIGSKPVSAPADLGAAGKRLWRSIAKGVAEAGFQLDEIERSWLRTACELEDKSRVLEAAMAAGDLHVRGSHGQLVLAPEWAEWRQQRQLQAQVLARVKKAVDEAVGAANKSDGLNIVGGVNHQRRGANIRWGRSS